MVGVCWVKAVVDADSGCDEEDALALRELWPLILRFSGWFRFAEAVRFEAGPELVLTRLDIVYLTKNEI